MAFVFTPVALPSSTFTTSTTALSNRRPYHLSRPSIRTPTPTPLAHPIRTTVRSAHTDRTFIAVKPDGMNRALLGNVISRFEAKGFVLVAIKTLVPSRQLAKTHYAALSDKPFFSDLVDFITSGPVCAMVWQGDGVVATGRTMIGKTSPTDSAPGTIRGDFGIDVGRKYVVCISSLLSHHCMYTSPPS